MTGRARRCAKCSKPSPSSTVPSQQTPLPVRGAACHTQNKMLARAELDIRISRCAGRFYPTDQHRSSALRGDAGRWKANLRGSKRHVKWVPSRRKSSFIYVALRGIARKNDVSLTPTVQPKRATGALQRGFAAARRAQRMLARFKHCLLVSRVESPHIACSLSGDLRSVTVPRVASHTSVRDRRELTKLSPRNRRTECPPR